MKENMISKSCLKAGLQGSIVRLEGKIISKQYLELLRISFNLDWVV